MFNWIEDAEYMLTSKEVVELLNREFKPAFETVVTSVDVSRWTKNYEINAIKLEGSRWRYREVDVRDFMYRLQHDLLHKFNSSFYDRSSIRVPRDVLRDFIQEEFIFAPIVCILVTLDPYALFNDPERKYDDLGFHEGGISFKGASVAFQKWCVVPKDSEFEIRKQRLLYPSLVAQAINQLAATYKNTEGASAKDRLLAAGWTLVNGRIPHGEYLQEVDSSVGLGGWRGLDYDLYNEIRPLVWVPMYSDDKEIL